MPRQPPLRHFNVILLKDGVSAPEDALRDDQQFETLQVAGGGTLALKPRQSNPPWWANFLRPYLADASALNDLFNSSNSAVLLLQAAGRQFAITFGFGRNLLDAATFERGFGLKVVLNTVAPDQLKSVDARTFDDLTIHTRRDVSQGSTIEAFGLDISRDLVRAVTGRPTDETLARQVTGSDALALRSRAQVPELPALCERLLEAYGSEERGARYGSSRAQYRRLASRSSRASRLGSHRRISPFAGNVRRRASRRPTDQRIPRRAGASGATRPGSSQA